MQPFKERISEQQYENCKKLIEYCSRPGCESQQGDEQLGLLSILWWNIDNWGAFSPYTTIHKHYGINGLNIHEYESRWVYNQVWSDNTPQAQAKRLRYLLEHGLPDEWEKDYRSPEFTSKKYEHIWKT